MRVLFLISTLGSGGAERTITQLTRRWASYGHTVVLATLHSVPADDFYAIGENVQRVSLLKRGLRRGLLGNIAIVWRTSKLFKSVNPEFVVSFIDRTNIIALLAARLTGHLVIACERTVPGVRSIGKPWEWMRRRLYPSAAQVVVQSTRAKTLLPPGVQVTVIPNAVEIPEAHAPTPEIPTPYLVLVGRFTEEKRHAMAVRAFHAVCTQGYSNWRLVMIGDGPLRTEIERLVAALGIAEQVCMLGTLPNPHPIMAHAACLVSTSRVEGFPMVVAEALALGVPVVATESGGGLSDLVAHEVNGMIVARDDEQALVAALARIMQDSELRVRLGASAQSSIAKFSPVTIDAQWFTMLETVARLRTK